MTDADVDGSHIRTLLLTFFYRQMPELVERGHIYIAQPPLYKAKQGKEEVYLKDEHELKQHLLRVALKGAELMPAAGAAPLATDALDTIAREYLLAEAVVERSSRLVDSAVLYAMLGGAKVDLGTETAANRSAQALQRRARRSRGHDRGALRRGDREPPAGHRAPRTTARRTRR